MRRHTVSARACLVLLLLWAPACLRAQAYDTLAARPDPHDFMSRDQTRLLLLGDTVRFMGYDLGWLGVRVDGQKPAAISAYEMTDVMMTARALGGTVVRARPIGFMVAGTPAQFQPDPAGLAALDRVIAVARDMGLKVIVPLAGSGADCGAMPAEAACSLARARGEQTGALFTDAALRRDFLAGVAAVLEHVNTLTGAAYQDDPAIMAWENCLACAGQQEPGDVATWSEQLGQAIKASDHHHLYENGAFAGRIERSSGHAVSASQLATPSVDIVGDVLDTTSDPATARARLTESASAVADAGRVFVLDSTPWTPSVWKTVDDLNAWIFAILHERNLSGVVAGRLSGHADGGGFLPPPPGDPAHGVAALYFPGIPTPDMDAARMTERGRGLRRLAYGVADITDPPAYLLPPKPAMLSAAHAHIRWLGAAGAVHYSIERSADPNLPNTWQLVCDSCATDLSDGWQDPSPTSPPSWYRIIPANINGHRSVPSEPVQATK